MISDGSIIKAAIWLDMLDEGTAHSSHEPIEFDVTDFVLRAAEEMGMDPEWFVLAVLYDMLKEGRF